MINVEVAVNEILRLLMDYHLHVKTVTSVSTMFSPFPWFLLVRMLFQIGNKRDQSKGEKQFRSECVRFYVSQAVRVFCCL